MKYTQAELQNLCTLYWAEYDLYSGIFEGMHPALRKAARLRISGEKQLIIDAVRNAFLEAIWEPLGFGDIGEFEHNNHYIQQTIADFFEHVGEGRIAIEEFLFEFSFAKHRFFRYALDGAIKTTTGREPMRSDAEKMSEFLHFFLAKNLNILSETYPESYIFQNLKSIANKHQ